MHSEAEGIALGSFIKADENVVFFPTCGHLSKDGNAWVIPVHGWIFQPEKDSLKRKALLKVASKTLRIDSKSKDRIRFDERAGWFLVDNKRRKKVVIRVGTETFESNASSSNGHFECEIRISAAKVEADAMKNGLAITAGMKGGAPGKDLFSGQVQLLAAEGISVISDIDDTIKISNVLEKRKLLANTFLKPYRAVPGMAKLYQEWAKQGATFHYVSSSPWQLYPVLHTFMSKAGFPDGSFHMRMFRAKDRSLMNLFKSSKTTKPPKIEPLLKAYPNRKFILSGDSGEQDPEVYGQIARAYPKQVLHIFIRDVLKDGMDRERMETAFKDVFRDQWTVFTEAEKLPNRILKMP